MKITTPQTKRLNPEPLVHCWKQKPTQNGSLCGNFPIAVKCTYPVCHCYDHDIITSEEADKLLLMNVVPMLERLRIFIDDLAEILRNGKHYHSREQLRVYRKRKIRLQKNFNFWKKRYDQIMYNKK